MRTGVALIGAGMVAPTYLDALARLPEVELRGVLATHPDSARGLLDRHEIRGVAAYDDLAAVTNDSDVSVALVATPPSARRDIVETLASAGKHILMEKPVERTLTGAVDLCTICEAAGVTLGIMLQHRARPVVSDLRELIAQGELGPLHAAEVAVPWFRPQTYYDEPGRGSYARDGGGVLLSQAIHTLDLALTFTGALEAVTALVATTSSHVMESEDFVSAGLEFVDGSVGTLLATTAAYPGRPETIRLHHGEGTATLRSGLLRVDWADGTVDTFGTDAPSGSGADPMAFDSALHRAVIADFVEAVTDGRTPLIPGRSALEVHRVIEAIERSGRSGRRELVREAGA